ncbi:MULTISPECIES: terminase large subunit [Staphylococcus]|uniref:terminase large subunit n=1 Tax=Staphylococcus TaxID=1279 RepID=UPI000CEB5741|nr:MULTISPECIES: terminase large subunit [Staphylococcus]AVH47355.1 terminase large subunit [Staphylococcus haemolyticus]MBE7352798.1 terminase large subunit [Staphylococcus haemolyticus]MCH4316208.1 terminase large subunit [Staphylococcus haemolyticus]MCH4466350.1 terminase large subunit [Staphylococcus haemolyticus]MDQ6149108.1 terminase large subunit [Staphylococcus haemolyticus]
MTIKILNKPSPKLLTTWYAKQVVAGKIIANKYVIKECERHLKYLKGHEKWIFDEELAHRPIRFIEKFCKPSKGANNQLILQPWQHFIIGSLFGWVHKETKLRRFKEALVFVGRKNGKTTTISGLANYGVSQDGENGAEIHMLANTMKQARLLFDESKAMIKASPVLKKNFRSLRDAIHYDKTISKIEPQASDSEKLDGLNTHIGIFDEIHEFKDYKLISVIKNSRAARLQPLLIYITTAGFQLNGPLVDMVEAGKDTLNGIIEDERTFYYLASLDDEDDINDSENWIKANPNIGVSIDIEVMKEEWVKAKRIPAERGDFITKRFNIFANNNEMSFIDHTTLSKNNEVIAFDELENHPCTVGYDLSETEDFTSACATFALENGKIAVLSHSWIPKHKVDLSNEKIPYREWEEAGYLTIQDKPYIDYTDVYDWILKVNEHHPVEKITYDRANAFRLNQELKNYGFVTEETRQGALTLSPALKSLKELFLDGKVIYNNNPLFKWYVNNVKLKLDRNGNWLPSKQSRYRKIDGFAALLNTYTDIMNKLTEESNTGNIEFLSIKDLMD